MRMAEAEKKMMQDDIISDDMLMVATSDFFGGGRPTDQSKILNHIAKSDSHLLWRPIDIEMLVGVTRHNPRCYCLLQL